MDLDDLGSDRCVQYCIWYIWLYESFLLAVAAALNNLFVVLWSYEAFSEPYSFLPLIKQLQSQKTISSYLQFLLSFYTPNVSRISSFYALFCVHIQILSNSNQSGTSQLHKLTPVDIKWDQMKSNVIKVDLSGLVKCTFDHHLMSNSPQAY